MTPVKSGSRAPTPTVDPTSKTYWDDLHKAEFINDAQLAAAKSGNVKDIDKADAEAYEMAIKESIETAKIASTPKQDKVINTGTDNQALIDYENPLSPRQSEVIGPEFNVAHRPSDVALVNKYTKEGYRFVQSSNKDHNCLIISILQHLTRACRQLTGGKFYSRVNDQAVRTSLFQASGGAGEWDDVMRCGMINGMSSKDCFLDVKKR